MLGPGDRTGGVETVLEEAILQCILALPGQAKGLWAQVPQDFFKSPPHRRLAQAIERQLLAGDISPAHLAGEIEDPEASRLAFKILSRVADDEKSSYCDYEEVWKRIQRDLRRHVRRKRLEELKRLMALEKAKGESETYLSLRREHFELLRESKKGGGEE